MGIRKYSEQLAMAAAQCIKEKEYWLDKLSGELIKSCFPYDFHRSGAANGSTSEDVKFRFSGKLFNGLMKLSNGSDPRLHMILTAAVVVLLKKYTYSGQEDIIIGMPIYKQALEGEFINTVLALRNRVEDRATFKELLLQVRQTILEAVENQGYPVEILIEQLDLPSDGEGFPLFDAAVLLENIHDKKYLRNFNLNIIFSFQRTAGYINGCIEFNSLIYAGSTLQRIIYHFTRLLENLLGDINAPVGNLHILPGEDRKQLLLEFNNTRIDFPRQKTMPGLFEEFAENASLHISVVFKDKHLTYGQLNKSANQLAAVLAAKGTGPGSIVGILVERSLEMIVGIMAILKSGGAYLPIEPGYPEERKIFMLKDSSARLLLTQVKYINSIKSDPEIVNIENDEIYIGAGSANLHGVNEPGDLAYVIYTSGTTGIPKGILTTHINAIRVVKNTNYIEMVPTDRVLQLSNYAFDGSIFDIYGALLNGAVLVLMTLEEVLEVDRVSALIEKEKITVFFVTTALFNILVDLNVGCFDKVRKVLFGGERVSVDHVKKAVEYLKAGRVVHVYGPTETTVYATYYLINQVDEALGTIPIGQPLANTTAYILDKSLNLLPIGVGGEIYIGGDGVARGYLNRPELTAEKFPGAVIGPSFLLVSPYNRLQKTNERLYKTGDLGRWLYDGNIEFIGRIDHQVKIRGFRIELGEIEACLLKHEEISAALVVTKESETKDKHLCAYIVAREELSLSQLKDQLARQMPDYMVPSHFVFLENIPLTSNGKVDLKALPEPGWSDEGKYVAPRDWSERKMAAVWAEVLGIGKDKISIGADFFELGGHSLSATTLVAKLHRAFGVSIPLVEVFHRPTIRELAQLIRETVGEEFVAVESVEKKEYYILSSAQKRLYILQQLDPDSVVYNMPIVIPLSARANIGKLEQVFLQLVQRHESFRTSFHMMEDEPVQEIHKTVDFALEYFESDAEVTFIRPFDLSRPPLLRVGLRKIRDNPCLLMVDMHHIISDGVSMQILERDFSLIYGGEELPALPVRYKDYSCWQNSRAQQTLLKEQENYWLKQFEEEVPVLELPCDYPRPAVQSFEGHGIGFQIGSEETKLLKKIAREQGATMYMVLLTVYYIFLSRLSGQEDIVVGTPIAGRRHADLQQIIGMFVNTLALRNSPQKEKTFLGFLHEVKARALEAFENQSYPFEDLVEKVKVNRDISRNPLFDVMFSFKNIGENNEEITRDETATAGRQEPGQTSPGYEHRVSKFDMTLGGMELGNHLLFTIEYSTRLFKKESMERFITYFKRIAAYISKNPGKEILGIEIISQQEKEWILSDLNNTKIGYPGDQTLHRLFEQQARKNPDNTALFGLHQKHESSHNMSHMSYKELNKKSQQLARLLRLKGAAADMIVGIMLERSLEMLIAIFGILKAGAAYMPIDPDYPPERIDYMLKDSGAKIFLTGQEIAGLNSPKTLNNCPKGANSINNLQLKGNNLAYIIYTSGTTGKPKGVMIEHRNVVRLLFNDKNLFDFGSCDVWTMFHSYCFDFSVWEMYGALLYGGKLIIISKMEARDPKRFLKILTEEGVTVLNQTPSAFYSIINDGLKYKESQLALRYIIFGGEALSPTKLKKWKERHHKTKLINMYGITETTVHVTYKEIEAKEIDVGASNMGTPIPTLSAYVLDKNLQLLPLGIPGEICVGGEGVGRGYLNRPALTQEKFIINPHKKRERLYRSGDLAKIMDNTGNMEYLGRIDQQVKIRGYRIELGEIENQLLIHKDIKEAVVMVRESTTARTGAFGDEKDKYICAYFVSDKVVDPLKLREYLSRTLPEYMVPSYLVPLEQVPLTANGKLDRRALPEPELTQVGDYIGPQDKTEEKLTGIWSEVLTVKKTQISIDANFFESGGHSLKATVMASRIHQTLDVQVPLAEIFKNPTIRELAKYIRAAAPDKYTAIRPVEERDYYPLSSAQKRLYILQQMTPEGTGYNMPLAFPLSKKPDVKRLEETFRRLISRHQGLRTSFHMADNQPVQKVHKLEEVLFTLGHEQAPSSTTVAGIMGNLIRPFDLSMGCLLRVVVLELPGENRQLVVDMHHIISDGVSHRILMDEFMRLYNGEELGVLRLQYKDYAHWQVSKAQRTALKEQESYWLAQFEDEVPVLALPTDYPRPALQRFEGGAVEFEISGEESRKLKEIALEGNMTLYMVLLGVYNILLSRLSGQEDIVVGTPIAGRRHADLQPIMGMFVNTLVLRNFPIGEKTFGQFLLQLRKRTLEAFENQDYPFEDLVEKVEVNRDTSRNPLFDVMFSLHDIGGEGGNGPQPESEGQDVSGRPGRQESAMEGDNQHRVSKFDMTLTAVEGESGLFFLLEYSAILFCRETIRRLIEYFKQIISAVFNNSDIHLNRIEILSEMEKRQILEDFNDTRQEYPQDRLIHGFFQEQVKKTPDHIAVVAHDPVRDDGYLISYQWLNESSDQLSRWLMEKGIEADTVVGIMTEPSIEMIIGILGILKAGGAYLPLDPGYPPDLLKYILADSASPLMLTTSNLYKDSGMERSEDKENLEIMFIDSNKSFSSPSRLLTSSPLHYSQLAYIIYTSGSTGKPKGVMVEHAAVVNILETLYRSYPLKQQDTILLKTSYVFDVSVSELFGWFMGGGKLAIMPKGGEKDPEVILDTIEKENITHINFVPSMFNVFVPLLSGRNLQRLSGLRYIFLAGETLLPGLVRKFRRLGTQIKLENLYGPTEATVYATGYSLEKWNDEGNIPIGQPLENISIYILDKYGRLQPVGISGELCIGGAGVGRGYLNRPGLTHDKFVEIPMGPGERIPMYRTGDLACWFGDGSIKFLGRIDHQVKIRGFRVELGEIENQLLKLSNINIKEVAVTVGETTIPAAAGALGDEKDRYLCAYIVSDQALDPGVLRASLLKRLPEYMVPTYFVFLEQLPLTPSGKINRKALPEPQLETSGRHIAPRSEVEKKLSAIWSEVLGIEKERISIDANFFALGGHSLKATIMISQVHRQLDIRVPLAEVFKTPTIRGLASFIKSCTADHYVSINPVEKREYYQLSSAQKRLYILQQVTPEGTAYNMPLAFPLSKKPDIKRLEETFRRLISRHQSLRTSFHMVDNQPVQKVHKLEEVLFTLGHEQAPSSTTVAGIMGNLIRPFDLSMGCSLRVVVLELPGENRQLVVDMHHIISDGVSHRILMDEFMRLYNGEELGVLRLQYKDYAHWQVSKVQRTALKEQESYWLAQFEDEVPVLALPTDYSRPALQRFEGGAVEFEISGEESLKLKEIALEGNMTLYMVLLGVYNILLSRLSGQEDIVVGTPIAGRRHADLQPIMGMFVNTLVLRNFPIGEKTFGQFLLQLRERTLEAFENQDYPFEDLVEKVEVNRDASRNPLFDVMFAFQEAVEGGINRRESEREASQESEEKDGDSANEGTPGLSGNSAGTGLQGRSQVSEYEHRVSKFDMNLTVVEGEDNLFFIVEYSTTLFRRETIRKFIGYFKRIISGLARDLGGQLMEIEILSEVEKRQILEDFNNTRQEYPQDRLIHEIFQEQARKTPDSIAVVSHSPGEGDVYISCRQLDENSNGLAGLLMQKGVKPDSVVGIMTDRSVEVIIGILGILKAGGAYLPIDPGYAPGRIEYILADSSAKLVVSKSCLVNEQSKLNRENWAGEILPIDPPTPPLHRELNRHSIPPVSRLAYVIYTSGSTGYPKGVMLEHGNVINLVWGLKERIYKDYTAPRKVCLAAPYIFDASVKQVFGVLLLGHSLYIVPEEYRADSAGLAGFYQKYRIAISDGTPLHLRLLLEFLRSHGAAAGLNALSTVQHFIVGGEELSRDVVEKFLNYFRVHPPMISNVYGPTECCVDSTCYKVEKGELSRLHRIPIGPAMPNSRLYIVNSWGQLQPVGIPGELCIAGAGVSRGYLNRPGLTHEKFVEISFWGGEKIWMYRTGDMTIWLRDGSIDFLGRMDHQVKIRGYRIELGEIENQLRTFPYIREAVVIVKEGSAPSFQGTPGDEKDRHLCAYIVSEQTLETGVLKEYLLKRLPEYMVPTYFVFLEQLPLTPSGKINRKVLPEPGIESAGEYIAPRDEVEKKLSAIWSEVLGIEKERISIDANFFALGGHSLKATIMISQVHRQLDIRIPLAEVFKTPTIKSLAKYIQLIKGNQQQEFNLTSDNLVLLKQHPNSDNHLFLIHDGSGEVEGYIEFCNLLITGLNYWGIKADRGENYAPRNLTIEEIACKYVQVVQMLQPRGPYYIAGWSMGGTIAFEMVRQLEQMNQEIRCLAIIDSVVPNKPLLGQGAEFTMESELEFVRNYLSHPEFMAKVQYITDIDVFWQTVVDYLESFGTGTEIIEKIKQIILENEALVIPNYNQMGVSELITYLNLGRTFRNARRFYLPDEKINTRVYYFGASQSKEFFSADDWNVFTLQPVQSYEIPGDHFSILQIPAVKKLAKTFDRLLNESSNSNFTTKDTKKKNSI